MGTSCSVDSKGKSTVSIPYQERRGAIRVPLTKEQRNTLAESWPCISEHWQDICNNAFISWFQDYPPLRQCFGTRPDEDLQDNRIVLAHVIRVHDVLGNAIRMASQEEAYIQLLLELGKFHGSIHTETTYFTGLVNHIYKNVAAFLVQEWKGSAAIDKMDAWNSLLRFVSGTIKQGVLKYKVETGGPNDSQHEVTTSNASK